MGPYSRQSLVQLRTKRWPNATFWPKESRVSIGSSFSEPDETEQCALPGSDLGPSTGLRPTRSILPHHHCMQCSTPSLRRRAMGMYRSLPSEFAQAQCAAISIKVANSRRRVLSDLLRVVALPHYAIDRIAAASDVALFLVVFSRRACDLLTCPKIFGPPIS